jgi:hypothetical protein
VKVKINTSTLRQTKWYEYVTRFLLGGAITVLSGIVAKKFGPVLGGLFLAFPAIFPASATLIEKHETQKKELAGLSAGHRGRDAAALDAAGATMGSIAMLTFAILVWQTLPTHATWLVLAGATLAWLAVSVLIWRVSEFL